MILQSKLLSKLEQVKHGFSTRLGGVSRGPYATLNLDRSVGDDDDAVRENRARFAMMLGLAAETEIVQVHQVHGTRVLDASEALGEKADGIIAGERGVAVGVRTADCVPVLIACTDRQGAIEAVGAVHAGWRGATAGIVLEAIRDLESRGGERAHMYFALGPAIGLPSFEVGDEVIEAASRLLAELGGGSLVTIRGPAGKQHLDLHALLETQLELTGVARSQIERVGGCTYAMPSLYFSHRRDRGITGRHLSAIAFV
jgi:polyphenol oxidase